MGSRKTCPASSNPATVVYRDRMAEHDGVWRITRRRLDPLVVETGAVIPAEVQKLQSVLELADRR